MANVVQIQRPQTDFGALGKLVGQAINPQQDITSKLIPVLLQEQFKSRLARKRQQDLINDLRDGGNGALGAFKLKIKADGTVDYEQKSESEILKDEKAQEERALRSGRQSVVPSAVPGGQQDLEPTAFDEFRRPTGFQAKEGLTGESAAKLTMVQQALTDLESVEKQLFTKEGKFLRGRAAAANLPGGRIPGIPSVGFGTEARQISSKINNALEAKLRIETGAAATQEEFNRLQDRFGITAFDTAQSAKSKLKRLKTFMRNAIVTIDPSGKFNYSTGDNKLDFNLNADIPEGWEIAD